ncbi:ethionine resistance protein [Halocaridina rubra]|uniref:Ethionine resistance protein n=1 Tax=Halocaridina rubra TaxID=373956 RepID=A0AAN9FUM3_HALRR
MSRDVYGGGGGGGGVVPNARSPRSSRRDLSNDPYYLDQTTAGGHHHRAHSPQSSSATASAAARRSRSATRAASPTTLALDHGGSYMDPHAAMEADRRSGSAPGSHHRSRSQSRSNVGRNYHSLDREAHDREFMPIRDRSMERGGAMDMHGVQGGHMARRDRSLDRGPMLEDDLYRDHHSMGRSRASPNPDLSGRHGAGSLGGMGRDGYLAELQMHNSDLQKELGNLKKELELTNQKLGSSMHSIKTFWSPELKKERALRKEESAKYSLINDQLKLLNSENQDLSYSNLEMFIHVLDKVRVVKCQVGIWKDIQLNTSSSAWGRINRAYIVP